MNITALGPLIALKLSCKDGLKRQFDFDKTLNSNHLLANTYNDCLEILGQDSSV